MLVCEGESRGQESQSVGTRPVATATDENSNNKNVLTQSVGDKKLCEEKEAVVKTVSEGKGKCRTNSNGINSN